MIGEKELEKREKSRGRNFRDWGFQIMAKNDYTLERKGEGEMKRERKTAMDPQVRNFGFFENWPR